jgi:beta-galactosidase
MAPRPGGDYDFADLDELFELAVAEGLDIVVNTILENAPYWLEQQRPQARYRDAEGRQVQLPAAMNTRRAGVGRGSASTTTSCGMRRRASS